MSNELLLNLIKKLEDTFGGIYPASVALNVDSRIVNYSTLWRWKNGKQKPNTATLERIGIELRKYEQGF